MNSPGEETESGVLTRSKWTDPAEHSSTESKNTEKNVQRLQRSVGHGSEWRGVCVCEQPTTHAQGGGSHLRTVRAAPGTHTGLVPVSSSKIRATHNSGH